MRLCESGSGTNKVPGGEDGDLEHRPSNPTETCTPELPLLWWKLIKDST